MGGWMDGWMGGWMDGKAGLRIAYSNQKLNLISNGHANEELCGHLRRHLRK